jgi:hypothetical protein
MLAVRIEEAAKQLAATVVAVGSVDELRGELDSADLIVADLAAPGVELEALAGAAKESGVPLLGFYPHVDVALRRAAARMGVERVYPRSRFLRELAALLQESLNG